MSDKFTKEALAGMARSLDHAAMSAMESDNRALRSELASTKTALETVTRERDAAVGMAEAAKAQSDDYSAALDACIGFADLLANFTSWEQDPAIGIAFTRMKDALAALTGKKP